jgi:hypothetical protein
MMDEKELFDHNLYYFRGTLRVLAEDAATQCDKLRNSPNVGWELSQDVIAIGRILLYRSEGKIEDAQRIQIQALIEAMERFPTTLTGTMSPTENLRAMQSPFWPPMRQDAARLLATLPNNDVVFASN